MSATVEVTQADRDFRAAVLKHIVETLDRPCSDGDMIEDRQDALDRLIARHRAALSVAQVVPDGLEELRELSEKATEGPWFVDAKPTDTGLARVDDGRQCGMHPIYAEWHDARLIARSVNFVRKLLSAVPASGEEG